MPLKAGPNGSVRHYSSSDGRYVKENYSLFGNKSSYDEERKRKSNENKKESILNKALKSTDPLVPELFLFIERKIPNSVIDVNNKYYFPKDGREHEIDILCKKALIEVKSGKRPRCKKQVKMQIEFARRRGIKHILFAPNITKGSKRDYEKSGILVVVTKEDLIKEIKK